MNPPIDKIITTIMPREYDNCIALSEIFLFIEHR